MGANGCDNCPDPLSERILSWITVTVALAVLGGLIATPVALYGWWAYDDWTCGFKECRVIKEVK